MNKETHHPDREDKPTTVSPPWPPSTKRIVQAGLLLLAGLLLYRVRSVLIPIIVSMIVAYAIEPLVRNLEKNTRISRNLALGFVYTGIIIILVAIPVGTVPRIVSQLTIFLENLPGYLLALGEFLSRPLMIRNIEIPLHELRLEEIYQSLSMNLIGIAQAIGRPSFTIFGNLASATISTVGWILIILFISFYMAKDHRQLLDSVINLLPEDHHPEMYRLTREISAIWNAFFRGRLVLCIIVGAMTFVIATAIELPNALVLAIIAAIGEFIPNIGPTLASIPAVIVAVLQPESSWLGSQVGPMWFALIVLGLYLVIQQIENTFLVPRIIGRHLNMHPMVVFIAALAGASVAGILGILLAAPVLATLRLITVYINRKLNDLPPFPDMVVEAPITEDG
jgi:predicted PurR-regulated permease PerM